MNIKTNKITVKPVKKYAPPKYPTRVDATRSPELLRKLPSRWQKNAAVVAAVGMLGVMSLTSCGIANIETVGDPAPAAVSTEQNIPQTFPPTVNMDTGDLVGTYIVDIPSEQEITNDYETEQVTEAICDSQSEQEETTNSLTEDMPALAGAPPITIYLSEQDALAIIKNMTEDKGLNLESDLPEYTESGIDLYDSENKVAVIYNWRSSIETNGENYVTSDGVVVGNLYDPEVNWNDNRQQQLYEEFNKKLNESESNYSETYAEYQNNLKLLLEQELREQVRDFIEWLQGQGII